MTKLVLRRPVLNQLVVLSAAAATLAAQSSNPPQTNAFYGQWVSTKFSGKASGDFIIRIEFIFHSSGEFSAKANLKDGKIDERQGSFSIGDGRIHLKVDGETYSSKYQFIDGALVIFDPQVDSQVWLARVQK